MAELGRICVYFDMLDFILKSLLITLEKQPRLPSKYTRMPFSQLIEKCQARLKDLECSFAGKHEKLIKDCRHELEMCEKLGLRRNELIHALWSPSAFQPHSATRIRIERKTGGDLETRVEEHDSESLRAVALEIRDAHGPLHALTVKFAVILGEP